MEVSAARTLSIRDTRAYGMLVVLFAAAVVLPVWMHFLHAPVRYLLPMHWPILLAGLVYGWRGGAILGAGVPWISFLISGYPRPDILPSMTLELFVYGFLSGILTEHTRWDRHWVMLITLIAGRFAFLMSVIFWQVYPQQTAAYAWTALGSGLVAAALQMAALPMISKRWVSHSS